MRRYNFTGKYEVEFHEDNVRKGISPGEIATSAEDVIERINKGKSPSLSKTFLSQTQDIGKRSIPTPKLYKNNEYFESNGPSDSTFLEPQSSEESMDEIPPKKSIGEKRRNRESSDL